MAEIGALAQALDSTCRGVDMVPCEIRWTTANKCSLCAHAGRSSALSRANEERLAGAEEEAAAVCRAAALRCC